MQSVTQEWEDTNRALFTRPAQIIMQIFTEDSTMLQIDGKDLLSFAHIKNGDIFSGILTQDKISFTVYNRENRLHYDASDNNGLYENARVDVYEEFLRDDGTTADRIFGGRYFIMDISKDGADRNYTFTAGSILSFMTEKSEAYSGDALTVAKAVIEQAKQSRGVPPASIEYQFDEAAMQAVQTDVRQEDGYSLAEVLQLIANACCCVLFADRYGVIHIEKLGIVSEHYVLAKRVLYKPLDVTYAERVGNIELTYDHGRSFSWTDFTGEKIGGTQMMTNPILDDMTAANDIIFHMLQMLQTGRKRFRASCRFDPALDLYDLIVIPNGSTVDIGCITSINASYNGAWKGDIQATAIGGVSPDLRIKDLELLTINQIEHLTIRQAEGRS